MILRNIKLNNGFLRSSKCLSPSIINKTRPSNFQRQEVKNNRLYSVRTFEYQANSKVGIVREVYNLWERRAPLNPEHVLELTKKGIKINIQSCDKRVYTDEEYKASGATITEDLSDCCLILGVKQIPCENIIPNKTYMFFSHVIKAQPENMKLLDVILERNARLIDYEGITNDSGQRLVAFGKFAGIAGMIDILNGAGQKLLAKGYGTAFLNSPVTYMYRDLAKAKEGISEMGKHLNIPGDISPLIFGFTGRGKVTQGSKEIFELLPHEYIEPDRLESLVEEMKGKPTNKVYGVQISDEQMVTRIKDNKFDKKDYRENPEFYQPIFHNGIAKYISVIVNGMYWDAQYPRLLTKLQLKDLLEKDEGRLFAVADISCDIEGSIEFLHDSTTIEKPFFNYDPVEDAVEVGMKREGVLVSGVDILPTQLPRDSTTLFGDALIKFIPNLVQQNNTSLNDIDKSLVKACIADHGLLTKPYEYINTLRKETKKNENNVITQSIKFTGHLFDTNIINQILDIIENQGGDFDIKDLLTRPNTVGFKRKSVAVIEIRAETQAKVDSIIIKLETLMSLFENDIITMKKV